ncbi:MAG: sigma 54-interacting transcriptional regulator [Planctomycetia bacterium]
MPSAPSLFLVVRDPVVGMTTLPLQPGERVTLGRAPTNHVVLHDEQASRFHAEIFAAPAGWTIRDLDSRNGTLLAGTPLSADHVLAPGDVMAIGRVDITVHEGEPPIDSTGVVDGLGGTATGEMPAELRAWHASITHRRAKSRLLDDIRDTAASAPRVGRAAAELCRLAFSLGRAAELKSMASLAHESAVQAAGAARGIVLLPTTIGEQPAASVPPTAGPLHGLEQTVATPPDWSAAAVPPEVIAAVLGTDEAVLASTSSPSGGRAASLTVPIRQGGRAVGVLHLEVDAAQREATPDDLEFVMAVCDALGVAIDNLAVRETLSSRLARTADENEQLRRRLGQEWRMIGSSAGLQTIVTQIGRVATSKATVLIRGESGAGKELVARAIHEASDRRKAPFVCMNCAALSETLLESELFGHEKGAFTGATDRKAGKFEAAHKGTLFLDEIGEMSPSIQAKFLRVLEGHAFERVGGSARVQVDVRVVAATNRHLEEAVAGGGFRRDLYFRLKVVEILVPPLRKRPDDIPLLATHFLERFAAETGRRVRGFTPEAVDALQAYHWPGNIRELRNAIERAVVLSQDEWIDAHELALSQLSSPGDTGRISSIRPAVFTPTTLDEMERKHVLATLEAVGGNKTNAAAILGIERSTLDRKMARWAKQ